MTALVSRSPLKPLSMSSVQRVKRKANARLNLEDDDALPAKKKNKVDGEGTGANGTAAARTRRAKQGMTKRVARVGNGLCEI
jgi:hypothetical protein